MDAKEFKSMLKQVLKESGSLDIKVDDYGYVMIKLKIDGEEILRSQSIDLLNEIKYAKDDREARAWT